MEGGGHGKLRAEQQKGDVDDGMVVPVVGLEGKKAMGESLEQQATVRRLLGRRIGRGEGTGEALQSGVH